MAMVAMKEKYLDVKDEYGNDIKFVTAYDIENGFIVTHCDVKYDEKGNKFLVKSLKPKRIYCKFKVEEEKK